MKPRPLIEATFTSVARIRPDSVKNSMAPERSWLSMSVSEPSWLFGNTWISTRPLVSFLIRATASLARTLSGWSSGELLAYLSWNSGAPFAIQGIAMVAPAAVPVSSRPRRVVLKFILFPPFVFSFMRRGKRLAKSRGWVHGEGGKADPRSARIAPVVDVERRAVDVIGAVAAQPENGPCHFFRLARAPGIDRAHHPVAARLRQLVVHLRLRRTRRDRVHKDAMRTQRPRPRLGEIENSGLGDAVPEIGMAGERRDRRHIDDAAAAARLHARRRGGNQRRGRLEVHRQDFRAVHFRDGVDRIAIEHARIVHERVELAEGVDQVRQRGRAAQVEFDALADNIRVEFLVEREDAPAGGGKFFGGGKPDAASGTRDENCFHASSFGDIRS